MAPLESLKTGCIILNDWIFLKKSFFASGIGFPRYPDFFYIITLNLTLKPIRSRSDVPKTWNLFRQSDRKNVFWQSDRKNVFRQSDRKNVFRQSDRKNVSAKIIFNFNSIKSAVNKFYIYAKLLLTASSSQ